jgi:hypothetical protein
MSRSHPIARSLAEGATFQLAFTAFSLAALAVWARACAALRHSRSSAA